MVILSLVNAAGLETVEKYIDAYVFMLMEEKCLKQCRSWMIPEMALTAKILVSSLLIRVLNDL